MTRIHLIHWNRGEAADRIRLLEAAGYEAAHSPLTGPALVRELKASAPDAFVVDLGRLPSQGRDVALLLRKNRETRHIPLVFVEGAPEKTAAIREILPDALYTGWSEIEQVLEEAIARPSADPVVPRSIFDPYAGRPLARKLGIKPGAIVALVNAPDGFTDTLDALPDGVGFIEQPGHTCSLTIWFVASNAELHGAARDLVPQAAYGPLWIAWPKKSSGVGSDLSEKVVRDLALGLGLVDYKVCSIDATWSGLLFGIRGKEKGKSKKEKVR